ncbi:MBL fold metallo-hydrolase [Candidatus Nitrosotalea okcheonensis]|uniref:Beta-lactamase domain protein n=1 Tax=Candidatus Nitrosotalea okcheonensis TaxID=1903276 RepID=A0A2H1FI93_9ARCH|nr:MBL fold metallo-hydrolase [Candidatus Nitrosotalea okcheonensis]SMH72444.1 Beta-lactamase domain protein [Candidatus Nitrosotalea okcheonensis]
MKVHQLQVGNMQNFTYVLEDEDTKESVIIDPSWDLELVMEIIERNDLKVKYIINTHHHFDHTIGNDAMVKYTKSKILQHEASTLKNDVRLSDGDKIMFGKSELAVLHTPGHSKDSICLVGDGKIFSGDALFVGNCGRTDLPGGSAKELYHSLFDIIYRLDDNLVLYPGHNYGSFPNSTISKEKKTNFVLQPRTESEFVNFMGSD